MVVVEVTTVEQVVLPLKRAVPGAQKARIGVPCASVLEFVELYLTNKIHTRV